MKMPPLHNLRVIDFGTFIGEAFRSRIESFLTTILINIAAGPLTTRILAESGANVIHVVNTYLNQSSPSRGLSVDVDLS